MNTRTRIVLTTLPLTLLLMAFHPTTPLGATVWPQDPDQAAPPAWMLGPFLLLFLVEAAASAFGVAYLFFGWRSTRGMLPDRPRLAVATHASVSFLLIQWWPHGNLHLSVPFSFGSILAIDYGFHVPLLVASLVILTAVVHVARRGAALASGARTHRAEDA